MQTKKLQVIDGETLMDTRLEPTRFVVEQLLPQGLSLLGGAPKIGKSWLTLDLCVRVAKGEQLWEFPTRQGTVLYLCLEDKWQRIQERLNDITDEVPPTIFFAVSAGTIADGLIAQIEAFVKDRPGTVLVAIDTFQMVRQNSDTNYANDYQDILLLKRLADRLGICLLLVHHLRKMFDADPLNRLSGSTGISGAADMVMILDKSKRGEQNATLTCTGRDIKERQLEISLSENHVWQLIADSVTQPALLLDPFVNQFAEFMRTLERYEGGNTELTDLFNLDLPNPLTAKALKQKMNKHRFDLEVQGIRFESTRSNGTRILRVWLSDASDANDASFATGGCSKICDPCVPCDPVSPPAARSPLLACVRPECRFHAPLRGCAR